MTHLSPLLLQPSSNSIIDIIETSHQRVNQWIYCILLGIIQKKLPFGITYKKDYTLLIHHKANYIRLQRVFNDKVYTGYIVLSNYYNTT